MDKLYWTVHINNFNYFLKYLRKNYKIINSRHIAYFIDYFDGNKYLYLSLRHDIYSLRYSLGYMNYTDYSRNWYYERGYVYKGEFNNRKEKLNKLDKISKEL